MTELLEGKTAVIYGAGGGIGGGVARTFAREGASVFLVGRTRAKLDAVAKDITRGDAQGTPLVDMETDDLLRAVVNGLRTNFITTRAAARRMIEQRSGVILHLNSASGEGSAPGMGSTGPADAATEAFMRYLAAELGPHGIRVCGIWTAGVADILTQEKLGAVNENVPDVQRVKEMLAGMTALRRNVTLANVAEAAAFLASDRAAGITGSMTNVTAGLVIR
jgi:NAD(P)-dependent dehydrogenase (short-subunit alcohol dehydrogenase family)